MFRSILAAVAALCIVAFSSIGRAAPTHASFTGANPYATYEIPGSANGYAIPDGLSGPFSNPNSPFNGFFMIPTVNSSGQPDWTVLIYGSNNTVDFDFGPNTDISASGVTYYNYGYYLPDQYGHLTGTHNLTAKSNSFCYMSGIAGAEGTAGFEVGVWYNFPNTPDSQWLVTMAIPTAAEPVEFNVTCAVANSGNITSSAQDIAVGTSSPWCSGQSLNVYHCSSTALPDYHSNICDIEAITVWNSGPVWAEYGPVGSGNNFEMGGPGTGTLAWSSCIPAL